MKVLKPKEDNHLEPTWLSIVAKPVLKMQRKLNHNAALYPPIKSKIWVEQLNDHVLPVILENDEFSNRLKRKPQL